MGSIRRDVFIGDIHGCLATFDRLLEQINLNKELDCLYLLGDYVDRGPDSKGVLDRILSLIKEGFNVKPIRGNHEQMLISDHHAEVVKGWFDMADEELKSSFEIKDLTELPIRYIDFCKSLPYYISADDFIAVHAGINFNTEEPLEDNEDLLWIRNWYENIDYDWLKGRKIIHGHTMQTRQEIEEQFECFDEKQVINIDGGVYLSEGKKNGLGNLCGLDLTNRKLYFQENIEKNCKY
jgi:serine/threonine protein phosphatase 1